MKWLAILPIIAGEADALRTADMFAAVHRAAELRPGVGAMAIDEFYSRDGDELVLRAARCASDVSCIASSMRGLHVGSSTASLALVVVLNLEVSPAIVAVDLISVENGTAIAGHVAAVNDRSALLSAIHTGTAQVLDQAGFSVGGRISVKTDPPGALVSIDGAPLAAGTAIVPAGKHRVVASAPDRSTATREVVVLAGRTSEVALVLEEPERSIVSSPWLWIGIGAALVIGGGIAAGVVLGSERCDCIGSVPGCTTCP